MANEATFNVVILWAHEIRQASKAVQAFIDAEKKRDDGVVNEEWASRLSDMVQACMAALDGADRDAHMMVIEGDPSKRYAPGRLTTKKKAP